MTTSAQRQAVDRAVTSVHEQFGKNARSNMGDIVYRALITERCFIELAMQDDSIRPENIVTMLNGMHDELIARFN